MPNTKALATLDDEWLDEIKTALATKPRQVVIPKLLAEEHDRFYGKAIAHAITKGEHEALMYFSFYVIWKNELYKAKCDGWLEYVGMVANEPHDLSASSIKHKVIDIDKGIKRGMKIENIIKMLGSRPMAHRKLLEQPRSVIPDDKINEIAEGMENLSGREAMEAMRELANEPKVWCKDAVYIPNTEEYLFCVVVQATDGSSKEFDGVIKMVDRDVAKWLFAVMKPRDREIK